MKSYRFLRFFALMFLVMLALSACRASAGGNSTNPITPTPAEANILPAATQAIQPTTAQVKGNPLAPTLPKMTAQPSATAKVVQDSATPDQGYNDLLKALDDLDAANQKGDGLSDLP